MNIGEGDLTTGMDRREKVKRWRFSLLGLLAFMTVCALWGAFARYAGLQEGMYVACISIAMILLILIRNVLPDAWR